MEASSRHQQIVNGTITPPNKTQISFTDETTSDLEIQTNWDDETTTRSDESSAESSTCPKQTRSKIAKSRRSTKLQQTISMKDEAAAEGCYSRPKKQKQQHTLSQLNSSATWGTSTIKRKSTSSTSSSVNCCPSEDGSYLGERRFMYAMDVEDKLVARVTLMDNSCRLAAFFRKDWNLEQLRNYMKSKLPRHNVKRLLYENYDLGKFVLLIDDNDLKECFRVSNDSTINLMVDAKK